MRESGSKGWPNPRSLQYESQLCAVEVLRRARPLASGVRFGVDNPEATLEQIEIVRRELLYMERVLRHWIVLRDRTPDPNPCSCNTNT